VVGSKGFIRAVTAAAAGMSLFALGPVATAGAEQPNLIGTWTGHRERIASTEGYRNGTATLVVTEQTGWTFKGIMAWSTPEGPLQDDLVGAFTPDGTLVAGADAEGMYSFKLVDPVTLDYCYAEDGEGYRTTCARFQRQP
jgi:hypothetical protein